MNVMNAKFREFVEALEPKFQQLVSMTPVKYGALPRELPKRAIYLFSENGSHLYVGRTNNLRNRLRGHCSRHSSDCEKNHQDDQNRPRPKAPMATGDLIRL